MASEVVTLIEDVGKLRNTKWPGDLTSFELTSSALCSTWEAERHRYRPRAPGERASCPPFRRFGYESSRQPLVPQGAS